MSQRPSSIYFTLLAKFISHGCLSISFENARNQTKRLIAQGTHEGPYVQICLNDESVLRKIALNPELGFPETYMDEQLKLKDTSLDDFIIFLFSNKQHLASTAFGKITLKIGNLKARLSHVINRGAAKKNVAHHYDLTDALYACFLDERRQYSCAYYASASDTIDQAQRNKIARLAAKLRIHEGAQILDIGCGWGELAYGLSALEKNVRVHGITLSENQIAYAKNTVQKRIDGDRLSFALQDYRDETNRYDNIISVGMLEHVGRKSFLDYFQMVSRCLKEDGTAVIHTIGKRQACLFTAPFITKYIFPGGYIPTLADLTHALSKTDLHIADVECLHNHYAETLHAWRMRCEAHKAQLVACYDERFYRMWLFYLTACEYYFRLDEGVVYQIQLIKRRDNAPSSRAYIQDKAEIYLKKLCQQKSHFGK